MMKNVIEFPSTPAPWFSHAEMDLAAHLSGFEPFVDEHVVARFMKIEPRRVLEMARKNEIPAHPIGRTRKTWRFRISEIDAHFSSRPHRQGSASIGMAVPGTQERKRIG